MKNPIPRRRNRENPSPSSYLKYTNIIYQIIGTIALGVFIGYLLDKWLNLSFPVFKFICSFGAVVLALYIVFKELLRKKE